jgi:RimJ/RimL family protein N-acetyltransferase
MMNIELQPFSRDDFKELISWIRDPDELFIWSATTFSFPLDENQLERHYAEAQRSNTRIMYAVVDSLTKQHVGHIELTRIDRETRKASIAYVLIDPEKRGHGYGKGMMESVLEECFLRMEMSRVDLFVFESNMAAIHLYQRMRFEIVELIQGRIQRNGKNAPLYLMNLNYEKWTHAK